MRCSCQICGTYMVHSESLELGCVCPECGYRCKECLGTDTVMSREELRALKRDPAMIAQLFSDPEEPEERFNPSTKAFGRGVFSRASAFAARRWPRRFSYPFAANYYRFSIISY